MVVFHLLYLRITINIHHHENCLLLDTSAGSQTTHKKMAFKCGILCVCSCTERRCKNDWSEKCKISNMLETHTFMYKWLRCSVPRHSVPIQHSAVCLGVFFGATVTASGDLQKLHTCISIVTEVQLYHCLPLVFTRTVNFVPLNRAVFERCSQHVFDTSVC